MAFSYESQPVVIEPETQGVVVVHCSDPRFQPHFQDFVRNGLALPHYALVAVPGGPHFLTLMDYLPKFSWAGWRWVKFLVDLTKCERLILIGHDDCRWYIANRFEHDESRLRQRVCGDLLRVRTGIAERFPRVRVESYFSTLTADRATFESV
jgi:hypothetical protein